MIMTIYLEMIKVNNLKKKQNKRRRTLTPSEAKTWQLIS